MNRTVRMTLAVCGLAAGAAQAQLVPGRDYVTIGSGGTLFEVYYRSPGWTTDVIDLDADGVSRLTTPGLPAQQLAPGLFNIAYRIGGSVNGLRELDRFGIGFEQDPAAVPAIDTLWNRALLPGGGGGTPGGLPLVPAAPDFRGGVFDPFDFSQGFRVDYAGTDAPAAWMAQLPGVPSPLALPTTPGYGGNPRTATDAAGLPVAQGNDLTMLAQLNTDNSNPMRRIHDTPLITVPIGIITNFGTGLDQIHQSDARHLFATGRRITGENLQAVTRDQISGTRVALSNGLLLDPSWGVGENIGPRVTTSAADLLGPDWQPSNKGGSARSEATVRNHRLAVGYTGAERGITRWLASSPTNPQDSDLLAVRSDLRGGNLFVRPTLPAIQDASENGYNIASFAGLASLGDPRENTVGVGGLGYLPSDPPGGVNVPMPNEAAAGFINNITRDLELFGGFIGPWPGDLIMQLAPVPSATTDLVTESDPALLAAAAGAGLPMPLVANPSLNALGRVFVDTPANVFNAAPYAAFAFGESGPVPTRTIGAVYTDGVPGGTHYLSEGGFIVSYGDALNLSPGNEIAYDFNADGARDIGDATEMMRAYFDRFPPNIPWAPPAGPAVVIEIIGDGTGDGNFNEDDIRYWADGLVLVNNGLDVLPVEQVAGGFIQGDTIPEPTLDREAGFTAVDAASFLLTGDGNFFGTIKATLGLYNFGDSRFDIAGNVGVTPGHNPVGHDGIIDATDINYIAANTGDFFDITQAVGLDASGALRTVTPRVIDLSCDMNGDLTVDMRDVDDLFTALETRRGDIDLDMDIDLDDRRIVHFTIFTGDGTGYESGDADLDGDIDLDDARLANPGLSLAELDGNLAAVSQADVNRFIQIFFNPADPDRPLIDLAAPFGVISNADVDAFVAEFFAAQ